MSESNGKTRFDAPLPQQEEIEIGGKPYLLREISGGAAAEFRNMQASTRRFDESGKLVELRNPGDLNPVLVSKCLFEPLADKDGSQKTDAKTGALLWKPVPLAEIRSWPDSLVRMLYDECERVSKLDEAIAEDGIEKQIEQLQELLERKRNQRMMAKN